VETDRLKQDRLKRVASDGQGERKKEKVCVTWCQCHKTFFPSSLMTRPNKQEGLSLETLSSQTLEFMARPEPTQLEDLSDASSLSKILVLQANVRLDWKVIARYKHSSLFDLDIGNEGKKFYNTDT
jgi:hypothetical protein